MRSLTWTNSLAVFVPELDDEHKEIFEALSRFQDALAGHAPLAEIQKLAERLTACIADHFAHEERLMRASRYSAFRWHQRAHQAAGRRVAQFIARIEQGDTAAGPELVEDLGSWLHDHAGVADRMMGAFLRNQERCMWKMTFQAGTKPLDACAWVDSRGDAFTPKTSKADK